MVHIYFLKDLAIIFAFVVLFGTAAFDKFKSLSTPEWFVKQFANTVLAKMPGGTSFGYWMIATAELTITGLFVASIFYMIVLPWALCAAAFLFGFLLFGLRITYDYQGSANMFVYFTATMVSFYLVTH